MSPRLSSETSSKHLMCFNVFRYLLVECNEDKEKKEGATYLNVMRRFSQALMKVNLHQKHISGLKYVTTIDSAERVRIFNLIRRYQIWKMNKNK